MVAKTLDKMISIYKLTNDTLEYQDNIILNKHVDNIWYNKKTNSFFAGSFLRAIDYLNYYMYYNENSKNITYWGSIDEIYKSN